MDNEQGMNTGQSEIFLAVSSWYLWRPLEDPPCINGEVTDSYEKEYIKDCWEKIGGNISIRSC